MSNVEEYNTMERLQGRFGEELRQSTLKGSLSFENSVQMLINRCMTCIPQEFEMYVRRLLNSIPITWIDGEFNEEIEKTSRTEKVYKFSNWCGSDAGTIKNPILDDEGNVLSPKLVEEEMVDYESIFNAILNLYNRRNLLLKKRVTETVPGSTEKYVPSYIYECQYCSQDFKTKEEYITHEADCEKRFE